MDALWWSLTIFLLLVGLIGTVVPLLPGVALIFAGAVLNALTIQAVGWPTLVVLGALALLAFAVDLGSGAVGAKYFGATRWGAIGGVAGALVGLVFGLPGLLLGPLLGAIAGEVLARRGALPALRSGWGTFLGTTAGLIAKFGIGLAMVAWFVVAALT